MKTHLGGRREREREVKFLTNATVESPGFLSSGSGTLSEKTLHPYSGPSDAQWPTAK
jgi:hypothetical protein